MNSPAKYKVCDDFPSGTLSLFSATPIPKKLTIEVTASSNVLTVDSAYVSSNSWKLDASSQAKPKFALVTFWT